ncbi:Rieske 2Fe-2S domain-containing protein, partial [Lacinutrix sp.]|uniref:Rieske (2Fe-2S) protein n=1 Tax=Lacinutrix sp. TaxID=1937692 RepID=UPI0025C08FE8
MKKPIVIAQVSKLENKEPEHALVNGLDLVIVKFDDDISVLYGRCLHRGALMSDGHVDGHNLICGVHGWDYRVDSGVSEYNNK